MQKKQTAIASFVIMLCLGSVYAWSIFVPELTQTYNLSTAQTQIIFGTIISVFTLTMIGASRLLNNPGPRAVATFSGLLFFTGYLVAYLSKGEFLVIWLGVGLLGGVGTGLGYLVCLSVPVKWYPEKKGLITGLVVAGFGAGAIVLTYLTEFLLSRDVDVLKIFLYAGILYGLLITLSAQFIKEPAIAVAKKTQQSITFWKYTVFYQLLFGIFAGTFVGLLVVGNLKPIAQLDKISEYIIPLSISMFAVANFIGRIVWGWMSDRIKNIILIPTALVVEALAALTFLYFTGNDMLFLALSALIGFCFGANFVLFARDTINKFGIEYYEKIYPYIFLGYGFAGVAGPFVGGQVYDLTGNYQTAVMISLILSLLAAVVYVVIQIRSEKRLATR